MIKSYKPRTALIAAGFIGVGILLAAFTSFVWGHVRASHEVNMDLVTSRLAAQQILDLRFKRLVLMSSAMAGDPSFTGYVLEAATASNDPFGGGQGGSGSVKDLLKERETQVGFDFGMVLDPNGGLVASTGEGQDDLSADPLFTANMKARGDGTGYWLRGNQLYQLVVTHLANHDQQAGYLVLALAVDQVQLQTLKQIRGAEQLVLDAASGRYAPVVGTLPTDAMKDVATQLQARKHLSQEAFDLSIGDEHWLASVDPLNSGGDNGVIVTLASYGQTMEGTYNVLVLLLAELLVLGVLGAVVDIWLVRRSPTWPKRPPG